MPLTKEEVNRKLLHILSGTLIPAGIFYIPMINGFSKYTPPIILGVLMFGSILLEFLRFKVTAVQKLFMSAGASMLRKSENHSVTGATYIFASAFICSLLFINNAHISFMVISMFILGDAIAAIVGISIGKIKIGKKSLEGSLACLITGLLLFFVVYPNVPLLLDNWNGRVPIILAILASFCNTILELFPVNIGKKISLNDNLTVPVVTGTVMLFLYPYFA